MPKINLLPKELSELIAAGEVVERPASVVKELVENSIDAGAKHITVEINNGGITYIRITDDGCGISSEDVKTAFLRHATSKIKNAFDLNAIATLGFRGEALAATSIVSKVELFTKSRDEALGTHYKIEGGVEALCEPSGCPDGTTIVVRDLFYNTPARMKFLKKDASEGTAVAAFVNCAALSHPEIAFKLIRDGKQTLNSAGDGKLSTAIYSVLGREFASSLIEVNGSLSGVEVKGYTCKPVFCKASRASQYIFLNGRLVRSGTVMAAAEQAYKNSSMVGKFPAFVLFVNVPYETVDVNVHPAKMEIRFSDERRIFEAVYSAVKNALLSGDTRPEIEIGRPSKKAEFFTSMTTEQYRQQAVKLESEPKKQEVVTPLESAYASLKQSNYKQNPTPTFNRLSDNTQLLFEREDVKEYLASKQMADKPQTQEVGEVKEEIKEEIKEPLITEEQLPEEMEVIFIGEAFNTYIIVQLQQDIYLIDKHAAHERIIFNELKKNQTSETQVLLIPVTVRLGDNEYSAVLNDIEALNDIGFEIEDFGNSSVIVRAVPSMLVSDDVEAVITEAAATLAGGKLNIERMDDIYHTIACKAAIKGGNITTDTELLNLAKRVLSDNDVMYCPHGRPVAFKLSRRQLEKQFGRIQ